MGGLLDIPGYGGFLQQGQLNDQQAQRRLQGVLGALQVAQGIEGMQDAPLKRQMLQAQVQGVLAQQKQQEEVNKLLDSLPPEQRALARIAPHQYVTGLLQERAKAQAAQAAQQGVLTMAERPGAAVMAPTNDVEAPAPVVNMRGTPGVLSSLFSNESPEIAGMARTGNELMLKGGFADVKDANAYVQKVMEMNASQAQARRAQQENIADRQFRQQEQFAQQDAMRRMIEAGRVPAPPPADQIVTTDQGVYRIPRGGEPVPLIGPDGKPLTKTAGKPDQTLAKSVQALGKDFEKAGLNQTIPVIENAAKITPAQMEYITGPKSVLMDRMIPEDARLARQDVQKLFNITLKDRSGAAVTNQELERLKAEFGKGAFKTTAQLQDAILKARQLVEAHYRGIAATYGKPALDAFNTNIEAVGGRPFGPGAPAGAPPAPPAGFVVDK